MEEIWKDIYGYEGIYMISNLGRVRSLPKFQNHNQGGFMSKDRILKSYPQSDGYLSVDLCHKMKRSTRTIHRLIMEHFIPNLDDKPQINHKNGIKTDNRIENLEWCTNGENQLHAYRVLGKTNKKKILLYNDYYNGGPKKITTICVIQHTNKNTENCNGGALKRDYVRFFW